MDELKARIGELTREVQSLNATVSGLETMRDEDRQLVDRVEQRTTKHATWLGMAVLGLIVFVLLMVGWNRFTMYQVQQDLTRQIVTCFLRPGGASPAQAEECARRNGGDVYRQQQRESQTALRQFADLQRWAVKHGWKPPAAKE